MIDLTGQTFGRLAVLECVGKNKHGKYLWRCLCSCGNEIIAVGNNLTSGNTGSCGCLRKEFPNNTTHGMKGTKIYSVWCAMKNRCYNQNFSQYDDYGGRGIKVCQRWHVFQNFYDDVSKLPHFGEQRYSLDRIDNGGDYCPENCRWITMKEQENNRRNTVKVMYNGEELFKPVKKRK